VLALATNDVGEAVPLLGALLSISTRERSPALDLTPQKRKEKTLKALMAQVEGLAARQPVLMVLEDAHWIDPTSLELLDLTVDRVPHLPVLLIITYRPEFTPRWIGRSQVTSLILNRLPPRQRVEMVARVIEGKALPKEIADQIIERTDGIPLFIEEMTKAVVESGVLADAGDHYTVARSLSPLTIPTTLHASLLARLDRLAPVREVAQIGAALGRHFSHELISAVTPLPHQQLDDALAQLVSAELIFRRGTPPDAEYTFKHALVQDAAYSTLLRGRRQQLHARIAETLELQFPEIVVTEPALLVLHCAEASLNEKAVGYWLKAGQQALARSAMREAVTQLTRGLEVLTCLPEDRARKQHELNLRLALGPALIATRGWAASVTGETYARALELCEQLDEQHDLSSVLYGQFVYQNLRGAVRLAHEQAVALWRLGEIRSDVMLIHLGRFCVGYNHLCLGEFIQARAHLEQGLALFDPSHRSALCALTGFDTHVATQVHLSRALRRLGYLDQARERQEAAVVEARQLAHAFTLAWTLALCLTSERGELFADARLALAEELLALSTEHGFLHLKAYGATHRGWCLSMTGRAADGIAQLTEGLAALRSTNSVLTLPQNLMLLAEVYAEAREPAEGLKHLAEATGIMDLTEQRDFEAELYRVRGELLAATDDRVAAEESYHAALAVARRQRAKYWELRAATSLARLWRDQGKRTEARDLLAPIYNWFTEEFDTPDLKEAKALLDLLK
jgi:tetratricopeptide (TPR) repeat protein